MPIQLLAGQQVGVILKSPRPAHPSCHAVMQVVGIDPASGLYLCQWKGTPSGSDGLGAKWLFQELFAASQLFVVSEIQQ